MIPVSRELVYLKPGEFFFGRGCGLIRTILGSCVAVTMFNRATGRSAVCHAVLPVCTEKKDCNSHCESSAKFVDCIVHRMTRLFLQDGRHAGDIEVKLFGGADGLMTNVGGKGPPGVGKRNIEEAVKAIAKEGLRLKASNVGGNQGRKLYFDTQTGGVLIQRFDKSRLPGGGRS